MRNIDVIRNMDIDQLTEWLFALGLNCVDKGKMDIRQWLASDKNYWNKDAKENVIGGEL